MSDLQLNSKILVAGARGLVGSALCRVLQANDYRNLIPIGRNECDLEDRSAVQALIRKEKPDWVLVAAAKVGGIHANNTAPYDFLEKNLRIELNLIHESFEAKVPRLIFLGSSCIYPKEAPQPIREESLLTGPLEPTNRPYALAKIAGIEMCWALNRQFGTKYFSVMPTNLYGIEDNFDLTTSHVLPALMRKFHVAKKNRDSTVTIWGSGKPRREFLYSDDLADGILHLMKMGEADRNKLFSLDQPPLINLGSGSDLTILELAQKIQKVVGFEGELKFDSSRPDGTMRKLMDNSKIASLGWKPKTSLEEGLQKVYERVQTLF